MLKKSLVLFGLLFLLIVSLAEVKEVLADTGNKNISNVVSVETKSSKNTTPSLSEEKRDVSEGEVGESSDFLVYDSPELAKPVDVKASAIRAGSSLLIVIALLIGFVFFLKFVVSKKDKPFFKERMLNVLERNYIEPKKTIMLVRAMDKLLVIGVAGDNINVLSEITDPEVVGKAISGDFHGYMKKYTSLEDKKEI